MATTNSVSKRQGEVERSPKPDTEIAPGAKAAQTPPYGGRLFFLHLEPYSSNQNQTLDIAEGLRAENWDTHIVCRASCHLAAAATKRGLPVHPLPKEGGKTLPMVWKLLRILHANNDGGRTPSLVHACDPSASQLASQVWRLSRKLRIVHTRRLPLMEPNYKAMRCYQTPQAKVITDSLAGKITLRLSGIKPHLLHTIACGINPDTVPRRKMRNDDRFIFGMTGELMPLRGHTELFGAVVALEGKEDLSPWEVRILGEGPQFTALLESAETLGVAKHLVFLAGPDAAKELCNCDVLVLPAGDGESYLPRILEGWAADIPVLTINRLDHAEILQNGVNCLLVQPGDMAGLAEQMARMVTDPELCEHLVKGGRATLEKFSLREMIVEHRRLYRGILA